MANRRTTAEEARREILEKYNRDPKGWRVFSAKDSKGYYDLLIIHGSDVWMIKEHHINPFKSIGYALKVKDGRALSSLPSSPDFGFRPVPQDRLEELLRDDPEDSFKKLIEDVIDTKPVPLSSLANNRGMIVQGPLIHYTRPIGLISQRNRELDLKLRSELENILIKRYPQTIIPYL
ncbi:MAG: hypothetical protein QXE79_02380 [Candidatus Bathyarchaeia archaeon]